MKSTLNGISRFGFGAQHEARLYRLLVKELNEYAMFFINPDGRIASWNTGVERILGYSEDEFLDLPFSILFTPEDQRAGIPEQELATAQDSGSASDERWHIRKSGERFFASGMVVSAHTESGELIGCTKILRDHTSRKLAEERLEKALRESKESEERFRRVLRKARWGRRLYDRTQVVMSGSIQRSRECLAIPKKTSRT